jgi:hypothetical protein
MPIIEEYSGQAVGECVLAAVVKEVPVTLMCRLGRAWHNLDTRIVLLRDGKLHLQPPVNERQEPVAMPHGLAIGLAFKLGHHKHILNTVVDGVGAVALGGASVSVICCPLPATMQRIQRRAYNRVEIPRSRNVLATFWQGENAAGAMPAAAVTWEGWLTNISAGGFQVRVASQGGPKLEGGDVVCVSIQAGQEYQSVQVEAQFRRQETDQRGVASMGFQFVGLGETEQGRETFARLTQIVCDFQRYAGRRSAYEHDCRRTG